MLLQLPSRQAGLISVKGQGFSPWKLVAMQMGSTDCSWQWETQTLGRRIPNPPQYSAQCPSLFSCLELKSQSCQQGLATEVPRWWSQWLAWALLPAWAGCAPHPGCWEGISRWQPSSCQPLWKVLHLHASSRVWEAHFPNQSRRSCYPAFQASCAFSKKLGG